MRKLRGLIIGILTVLLMAGCIYTSALADDSSAAPNNWGGDMMGLTQAKASVDALINDGVKLPEIKVAVIDTGANANHDLLKGRILPSSKSFINSDTSDYTDQNGHGTHVAGIIAQNTPSNVKILVLQALDQNKKGEAENIADAIAYAVDQGAVIINLSLGISEISGSENGSDKTDDADEVTDHAEYEVYKSIIAPALAKAKAAGCVITAAAGNSVGGRDLADSKTYPAISDDVITVSAISNDTTLYENSNYGEAVDFCAPGDDIDSAGIKSASDIVSLSGTSMATPFISSAYAMLRLYNPRLSVDELTQKMQGEDITQDINNDGPDVSFGYGLPVFSEGDIPHTKEGRLEIDDISFDGEVMTIRWNAEKGLFYDIYRKDEEQEQFICIAEAQIGGEYVDKDVVDGKTYEYYIEAEGADLFMEDGRSEVVTQKAEVEVTEIESYTQPDVTYLCVGEIWDIAIELHPLNASMNQIIWESSDDSIASVVPSEYGAIVTAVSPGEIIIQASALNGKATKSFRFQVYDIDPEDRKCGDNAYWDIDTIDGETVFTVSGSGDMYDYMLNIDDGRDNRPWKDIEIDKVVIEDGITRIGNRAFDSEAFYTYDENNDEWLRGGVKSIEFGNGLKSIGEQAFCWCAIEEVSLPEGLKTIETRAFSNNENLTHISFPRGLEAIGDFCFNQCASLSSIRLPEGLKELGNSCFSGVGVDFLGSSELELPEGLESIGSFCFGSAGDTVYIPASVAKIGDEPFGTSHPWIVVSDDNEYYAAVDGVLYDKDYKTIISCPTSKTGDFVIPETVETIREYAFENSGITSVTIPESVSVIPHAAFWFCNQLQRVTFPNTDISITGQAFYGCEQLTEIELPEGLVELGGTAFGGTGIKSITISAPLANAEREIYIADMDNLEEVRFSEGTEKINSQFIWDCPNLKTLYLPASLKRVGHIDTVVFNRYLYAFDNCEGIQDVYYSDFTKHFKEIDNVMLETSLWNALQNGHLHIETSGLVNAEITWAVTGVSGDLTLTISGTGSLPNFDDPKDAPWYDGRDEITHVVIEDGITSIGANDFSMYKKIEDVTLPESVEGFSNAAFRGCNQLVDFYYVPSGTDEHYLIEPRYLLSLVTGEPIEPEVYVAKDDVELVNGRDYTVSYENNTSIGQALIKVEFIGDHAGKGRAVIPFTITDKLLDGENIRAISSIRLSANSYEYDGREHKPDAEVKSGRWVLTENADFKLSYSSGRKDKGRYRVVAEGIGAYTGMKWDSFEITPKNIAGFSASLSTTSYTYDGKAKTPSVSVSGLTANDYSVSYSDNTEVGTGIVTITGKGNYTGQKELTFTIKEAPQTDPEPTGSDDNQSNSNNSGSNNSGSNNSGSSNSSSNNSGSNASGKSSNASGTKASSGTTTSRRSVGTSTSSRTASSRSASRTGASGSSGTTSSRRSSAIRNQSAASTNSGQSKKKDSDKKDKNTSGKVNNKDKKTETGNDIATKNDGLAKDTEIVHEVSTEKESSIPDTVKYIAAGLFLAVAVAGIVFLILMLKKKKKKAA